MSIEQVSVNSTSYYISDLTLHTALKSSKTNIQKLLSSSSLKKCKNKKNPQKLRMPKAKQFTLQCEQVITINNEPRFKIGNFLGHGGFGVTHEGFDLRHKRLGHKCSVKRSSHDTVHGCWANSYDRNCQKVVRISPLVRISPTI